MSFIPERGIYFDKPADQGGKDERRKVVRGLTQASALQTIEEGIIEVENDFVHTNSVEGAILIRREEDGTFVKKGGPF
jgi:hypothetical protein